MADVSLKWIVPRTLTAALMSIEGIDRQSIADAISTHDPQWLLVMAIFSIYLSGEEKPIERYKARIQIGEDHKYICSF